MSVSAVSRGRPGPVDHPLVGGPIDDRGLPWGCVLALVVSRGAREVARDGSVFPSTALEIAAVVFDFCARKCAACRDSHAAMPLMARSMARHRHTRGRSVEIGAQAVQRKQGNRAPGAIYLVLIN